MSVMNVSENNFSSVETSDKTVLLDFFAEWCGPCKSMVPVIDELAIEHPEYLVGKIDVDKEAELAKRFGVMGVPTFVVLKDGKTADSCTGTRTKDQLLQMLKG